MDFNLKWFLIGIGVGLLLMFIFSIVLLVSDPYENIEQVCYDNTFTAEEFEECVEKLRNS